MTILICGAISHNMFLQKCKSNQHELVIIPLIPSCHLEKNSLLELKHNETTLTKVFDNFPLTKNQIVKMCHENKNAFPENKFGELLNFLKGIPDTIQKQESIAWTGPWSIAAYCIFKIAKPEHKLIGGAIWCTQLEEGCEEYWLCKEDTCITLFAIAYIQNKKLKVPKKNIIIYEVSKCNNGVLRGCVKIDDGSKFFFSKNISLGNA